MVTDDFQNKRKYPKREANRYWRLPDGCREYNIFLTMYIVRNA